MVRLAGAALLVAGLVLGIDGLTLTGAIWLGFGLLVRFLTRDMRIAEGEAKARGEQPQPPSGRRLVLSTLVWLLLGVPAIVIGLAEVGFDEAEAEWRWLPVALGSIVTAIGLVGAALYGLGKGIGAVVGEVGATPGDERESDGFESKLDAGARLEVLDGLLRDGKITAAEHAEQRTRILGSI
jgi:hypothetical protein